MEREDGSSETESAKLSPSIRQRWQQFRQELEAYAIQVHQAQHSFAFAFVEGSLVHALREGHWVLLDEVNLASPETLECLNGLLDNPEGSVSRDLRARVMRAAPSGRVLCRACCCPQSDACPVTASFSQLTLTERGDLEPVRRHPDFRLFACMNPATDVGKRNLPTGLRNR